MSLEIYIYDKNFNNIGVLDQYQSFIWTDRYSEPGDFELYLNHFKGWSDVLIPGNYVKILDSKDEYMIIEDVKTEWDYTGQRTVLITGRSLDSILDRRIILSPIYFNIVESDTIDSESWYNISKGSINTIVHKIIKENCIDTSDKDLFRGFIDGPDKNRPPFYYYIVNLSYDDDDGKRKSKRAIPNLIYDSGDLALNSFYMTQWPYNVHFENISVLEAITSLCRKYQLGFKMVWTKDKRYYAYPNRDTYGKYCLMASLYDGVDRSDDILFSPSLNNLSSLSVTEYNSKNKNVFIFKASNEEEIGVEDYRILTGASLLWQDLNFKNYKEQGAWPASVYSKIYLCRWWELLTAIGESGKLPIPSGLDLKEAFSERDLKSTYIGLANDEFENLDLTDDQIKANARHDDVEFITDYHRAIKDIDAKIDTNNVQYKLGVDYNLGDIVGVLSRGNVVEKLRVTAITHVQNSEGYKVYPTFEEYVERNPKCDETYKPTNLTKEGEDYG